MIKWNVVSYNYTFANRNEIHTDVNIKKLSFCTFAVHGAVDLVKIEMGPDGDNCI